MGRKVHNIAELQKRLEKAVEKTISNDVSDAIKETVIDHAIDDVYGAREPMYYRRRLWNKGLIDPANSVIDITRTDRGFKLRYTNTAQFTGSRKWQYGEFPADYMLADLISDGYAARDGESHWYNSPRPFIENAKTELVETGKLQEVFEKAIKKYL